MLYDGVADHAKQEGGVCAPVYPCLIAVKDDGAALHACRVTVSLHINASTSNMYVTMLFQPVSHTRLTHRAT